MNTKKNSKKIEYLTPKSDTFPYVVTNCLLTLKLCTTRHNKPLTKNYLTEFSHFFSFLLLWWQPPSFTFYCYYNYCAITSNIHHMKTMQTIETFAIQPDQLPLLLVYTVHCTINMLPPLSMDFVISAHIIPIRCPNSNLHRTVNTC